MDSIVTDRFLVKEAIKTHPEIQVGEIVYSERNGMAVKKKNKELHRELQKALKAILDDGFYAKLSQKYFGEDIRCQKADQK